MRPSEGLPEQKTACGGESSSLLRPEDDVSQARYKVTQKISSTGKGNHLLGLQWERALAAVDGVPCPHADQSF
ncbi:hypothetical protein E2C01_092826 [Portunus trituberculatus]|uniref:Uncharacterized protein n=1 Tax=Portunus trituberculatus TaxID=210409 RepID=A0A5B7JWY6_PORTR|nr:hypothetical protein [Portunus trituberculatus]